MQAYMFSYLPQKVPADHGRSAVAVGGILPWQRGEGDVQQAHVDVLGRETEDTVDLIHICNINKATTVWWVTSVRLTSCFIKHFPSSVSSSVGWFAHTGCTESIIISSSTSVHIISTHLSKKKTKRRNKFNLLDSNCHLNLTINFLLIHCWFRHFFRHTAHS